jgi:hypothetical protein
MEWERLNKCLVSSAILNSSRNLTWFCQNTAVKFSLKPFEKERYPDEVTIPCKCINRMMKYIWANLYR